MQESAAGAVREAIQPQRLLETAIALIDVPSPTRSAAEACDRLAEILSGDGFAVERPEAGWPDAPAVAARYQTTAPGRTLQFNGHLDTVHLPFVPPRVEDGALFGSGCADMKGGIAAAVEAMRALRDSGALEAGGILLTAHDLHEAPWGDGSQVNGLIDAGYVGDGVLLPEYLADRLPVIGRGLAVFEVEVTRDGEPVHEVLGGIEQPNVIQAGAELIGRFAEIDRELSARQHPQAGRESLFVGQVHGGEIYNQSPTRLELSGTRRWLPDSVAGETERQWRAALDATASAHGVQIEGRYNIVRDAFEISPQAPLSVAFQDAYSSVAGESLPVGAKPFVDDANAFIRQGGVTAITHGPNATGAHTLHERCPLDELTRVAQVYALTALAFCGGGPDS